MTDLREDVALAGNPTNLWTDHRVRDGDVKLAALGKADRLGALLWRLKYRGEARLARQCIVLLSAQLREDHRWQRTVRGRSRTRGAAGKEEAVRADLIDRLAFRVLMEWVNDRCTTCHGRGSIGSIGSVVMCSACSGSCRQPQKVLDPARALDLGVTRAQYYTRWLWVIEALLGQLAQVDEDVKSVLKSELKAGTVSPSADRKAA